MTFTIRQATKINAASMCDMLNPIIKTGGSTAHINLFTPERMQEHYIAPPRGISCFFAESDGQILGFQALEWADPKWDKIDPIPEDWAIIASFVSNKSRGLGVGRALFSKTLKRARLEKMAAIDATIRADNVSGLGFYSALGFVDYERVSNVALSDGTQVDRIRKKFML